MPLDGSRPLHQRRRPSTQLRRVSDEKRGVRHKKKPPARAGGKLNREALQGTGNIRNGEAFQGGTPQPINKGNSPYFLNN